jgi:hypothetical protein
MITIDEQLCPLSQAKRLKRLGVSQDAYFQHWFVKGKYVGSDWYGSHGVGAFSESFAAYSVAELGIMLPDNIEMFKRYGKHELSVMKNLYPMPQIKEGFNWFTVKGDTEAEARAEMLISLIEAQLVKVDDINLRLHDGRIKCSECNGEGGQYVGPEPPDWEPCMNCEARGYHVPSGWFLEDQAADAYMEYLFEHTKPDDSRLEDIIARLIEQNNNPTATRKIIELLHRHKEI